MATPPEQVHESRRVSLDSPKRLEKSSSVRQLSKSWRQLQQEPPSARTATGGASRKKPKQTKSGKRRYKPGTVALREIRKIQRSGALLIKKAPFGRLVRDQSWETIRP